MKAAFWLRLAVAHLRLFFFFLHHKLPTSWVTRGSFVVQQLSCAVASNYSTGTARLGDGMHFWESNLFLWSCELWVPCVGQSAKQGLVRIDGVNLCCCLFVTCSCCVGQTVLAVVLWWYSQNLCAFCPGYSSSPACHSWALLNQSLSCHLAQCSRLVHRVRISGTVLTRDNNSDNLTLRKNGSINKAALFVSCSIVL